MIFNLDCYLNIYVRTCMMMHTHTHTHTHTKIIVLAITLGIKQRTCPAAASSRSHKRYACSHNRSAHDTSHTNKNIHTHTHRMPKCPLTPQLCTLVLLYSTLTHYSFINITPHRISIIIIIQSNFRPLYKTRPAQNATHKHCHLTALI